MAPRTTRFYGPTLLPASYGVLYTVPSGRSALLRWVQCADGGVGATFSFDLTLNGVGTADLIVRAQNVPVGGWVALDFYLGLNAGDVIRGRELTGTRAALTLSGYLYG